MNQSKAVLQKLYAPISTKLQSEQYTKPGGYELYKTDMNELELQYTSTPGKGIMVGTSEKPIIACFVLNLFLSENIF